MRRYMKGDVYLNINIGFNNGTAHYNNSEESA